MNIFDQRKSLEKLKETLTLYQKNQIQLNRLYSQKAAFQNRTNMVSKNNRKARTRTLIQIGGLVAHSGLTDLLGIQMGEDLQKNAQSRDKGATLLGIFLQAFENFQNPLSDHLRESLKLKGLISLSLKAQTPNLESSENTNL